MGEVCTGTMSIHAFMLFARAHLFKISNTHTKLVPTPNANKWKKLYRKKMKLIEVAYIPQFVCTRCECTAACGSEWIKHNYMRTRKHVLIHFTRAKISSLCWICFPRRSGVNHPPNNRRMSEVCVCLLVSRVFTHFHTIFFGVSKKLRLAVWAPRFVNYHDLRERCNKK